MSSKTCILVLLIIAIFTIRSTTWFLSLRTCFIFQCYIVCKLMWILHNKDDDESTKWAYWIALIKVQIIHMDHNFLIGLDHLEHLRVQHKKTKHSHKYRLDPTVYFTSFLYVTPPTTVNPASILIALSMYKWIQLPIIEESWVASMCSDKSLSWAKKYCFTQHTKDLIVSIKFQVISWKIKRFLFFHISQTIKPNRLDQRLPTLGSHIEEHRFIPIHSNKSPEKKLLWSSKGKTRNRTSLVC